MSTFFERLTARAKAIDSLLCVGIDPDVQSADELVPFAKRILDATLPYAAAYKPNAAFFERFGAAGAAALAETIALIGRAAGAIPVILDAKRGDIGRTNEAYRDAAFAALGADALTVSPYLGLDTLSVYEQQSAAIPDQNGLFILCRTSNRDAHDLQALQLQDGKTVYEWIAARVAESKDPARVGLVVGATDLTALAKIRALAPDHWFLVPGIGRQGGDLSGALRAAMRADGLGVLINVSSAIADAADPAAHARDLVATMRAVAKEHQLMPSKSTTAIVVSVQNTSIQPTHQALASGLLDAGIVRFGEFTLKSGLSSPIYLDFRRIVGFPRLLANAADAYADALKTIPYDCIAALPYAAMPLGTATSLRTAMPMIYPRKEAKEYGTKALIEGVFQPGQRVVMLDDLATTGGSKLEAQAKLQAAGLDVRDVLVLVDREGGARAELAKAGLALHSVFGFRALLHYWVSQQALTIFDYERTLAYLDQAPPLGATPSTS